MSLSTARKGDVLEKLAAAGLGMSALKKLRSLGLIEGGARSGGDRAMGALKGGLAGAGLGGGAGATAGMGSLMKKIHTGLDAQGLMGNPAARQRVIREVLMDGRSAKHVGKGAGIGALGGGGLGALIGALKPGKAMKLTGRGRKAAIGGGAGLAGGGALAALLAS